MLEYWSTQSAAGIPGMQRDIRTITLNVLASTVFKETSEFIGSAHLKMKDLSTAETFRDALFITHYYIIHLMIIPYQYLVGKYVPESLYQIGHAALRLKQIMIELVKKEKAALKDGKTGSGGLVTSLVRAIDHTSKRGVLSIDETLGNIFMINFAGLDTTANVLAFTLLRLAGEPEVQHWLHEEIVSVTQGLPVKDWEYEMFPRLKRCFAVFLETLRIYPPVNAVPKVTASGVHAVHVGDQLITIPPGTEVFPMLLGIQTDPEYWPDPFVWKPSRWIMHGEDSTGTDGEELLVPEKGTFFPWSDGVQNCLGKKISQVEAVAVLASLLATHRLVVKAYPGETQGDVQKRIKKCCDDNNYNVLLEMNDAAQIGLECVEI